MVQQPLQLMVMSDKHIDDSVVTQLRHRGVDVLRVPDVQMDAEDDELILEYATEHGRTVLTFDSDFEDLHKQWMEAGKNHCGIFKCYNTLHGQKGIGKIVTIIFEYYELIRDGVGTVENDIYNQVIYMS